MPQHYARTIICPKSPWGSRVFFVDLVWNNPITRRTLTFFARHWPLSVYLSLCHITMHMTKCEPFILQLGVWWCCHPSSLYLVDRPDITTNPVSQLNVVPGTNVTFMVVATGSDLTYQWQRNGGNLTDGVKFSGTTTPTLTVMNVMEEDEGDFTCVVTNVLDSVTSSAAHLMVYSMCVCTRVVWTCVFVCVHVHVHVCVYRHACWCIWWQHRGKML